MLANPPELVTAEPTAVFQADGVEPEFGNIAFSLDVYMRRFVPVRGVDKEAVRSYAEQGRHTSILQHLARGMGMGADQPAEGAGFGCLTASR